MDINRTGLQLPILAPYNRGPGETARNNPPDERIFKSPAKDSSTAGSERSVRSQTDSDLQQAINDIGSQSTALRQQINAQNVSSRASQALHAYAAQQDQPQKEKQAVISRLLGVDYYV